MRRHEIHAFLAATLLIALNVTAAQDESSATHNASADATSSTATATSAAPIQPAAIEARILVDMRQMNQSFIQLGRLARHQAADKDIRRLGDRMVRDHTLSQRLIAEFARNHNITLPETAEPAGKPAPAETAPTQTSVARPFNVDELKNTSGMQFDSEFLSAVKTQYARALETLTRSRDELPASSIMKNWLGRMLPILRQNESIAARLSPAGEKEAAR